MLRILAIVCLTYSWNIDEFGAVRNEISIQASQKNGEAFNKAVLAANSSTNDRTVVISGEGFYEWLPAGPICNLADLKIIINSEVWAWRGAQKDWPVGSGGGVFDLFDLCNTVNLVITGNGLVNGFGYHWWWYTILTGKDNRPNLLHLNHCVNTLIEGVTFKNSPKYHLNLEDMSGATIQSFTIHVDITNDRLFLDWIPTFPLNTDGIDISGINIYFRNLTIQNFDDAIAVKPTHANSGGYTNCTQNIFVEDCYVKYGVGMSIGSVPPNDDCNCIQNVTFRNINFQTPLKAIYIKPNPGTHGTGLISNIVYENIEIHEALWWAIYIGTQQQHQPGDKYGTGCSFFFPLPGTKCPGDPLVTVDTIILRNVNIYGGLLSPGILLGNETNPCTNFLFDSVNVYNRSHFPVDEGYYCRDVEGYAKNSNLVPPCFTIIEDEKEFLEVK